MATQYRPYQGYPYTNPPVSDVPSIDAAAASRWADLPRRQLHRNVYVDIPEESQCGSENSRESHHPDKKDLDANPVVYIDVPESSSSSVAGPVETAGEPEYVQETIFYNPFDNRRIDQGKEESARSPDSDASFSRPPRPPRSTRPAPPSTLNLTSPGSSGYSSNYTTPGLPPSMSPETNVYQPLNNGPTSPVPSQFAQPPPYTEVETPVGGGPVGGVVDSQRSPAPMPSEPPRTVVITLGPDHRIIEPAPIGLPNPTRKVVYCQHCGHRVHTMVIRKTGAATHVVALSFFCIGLFPLTILVYITDTFKNKNHYCPNCNKLIGYEVPGLCKNMTYSKTG